MTRAEIELNIRDTAALMKPYGTGRKLDEEYDYLEHLMIALLEELKEVTEQGGENWELLILRRAVSLL